jgi:transposase
MYISPINRFGEKIFNCLDDMVAQDNPIRILDKLIDKVIEKNPEKYTYKGSSNLGRPAYSPKTMLKTIIYGYINGISSFRKLEHVSYINLELIWLTGNLHPDYNTISHFSKNYQSMIIQFFTDIKNVINTEFDKIKTSILKQENYSKSSSNTQLSSQTFLLKFTRLESNLFKKNKPVKIRIRKSDAQISLI